jgi:hypothetical protein
MSLPSHQNILQEILHTEDERRQKPPEHGHYQTAEEEKIRNKTVALIHLHTVKSLNNKNN